MVRRKTLSRAALTLLIAVPLFAACEDETTNPPTPTAPLFARYAAIGNSLTAGFQSGGINDSTQMQSYAVQLADAFDTDFNLPLLNWPGCPAPLTNIFTQETLGDGVPGYAGCAYRMSPIPEWINNVAVPGAAVIDVLYNLAPDSDPNSLTSFILGGRTQFEAAKAIHPTFVSVAIGSNDILGALLDGSNPGDPALVTSPADFAARYEEMLDSLTALPSVQGGVLIGLQPIMVDAATGTLSVPYFTAGGAWMQFELQFDAATAPVDALDVDPACATAFVPFAVGAPMLAMANAKVDSVLAGQLGLPVVPVVMTCTDNQAVTAAEFGNVIAAHTAFNATIQQEATDRGWAYFDPAAVFAGMAGTAGAFRPFPAFDPTDPQHPAMPFGFAVSHDGIHWSATLHDALATAMITAIEAHY